MRKVLLAAGATLLLAISPAMAAQKIGTALYERSRTEAPPPGPGEAEGEGEGERAADEDVVDAEIVDDDENRPRAS